MPKINTPKQDWIVWRKDDIEYLLSKCNSDDQKVLIAILYRLGCRISEALSLRRKDFWTDDKYLHVNIMTEKNPDSPQRHLLLNKKLPFVDIIIGYVANLYAPDQKLFSFPRQSAWLMLKKIDEKAWPHSFRHARASRFAWEGADVLQLVSWFGWSDPRMAQNYVKQSKKLIEPLGQME